jgi:hypothetical protein
MAAGGVSVPTSGVHAPIKTTRESDTDLTRALTYRQLSGETSAARSSRSALAPAQSRRPVVPSVSARAESAAARGQVSRGVK